MMRKMYCSSSLNEISIMYIKRWKLLAIILLMFWLVVTYLVISPLRCNNNSGEVHEFQQRLKEVSGQLELLKHQNNKLLTLVKKSGELGSIGDIDTKLLLLDAMNGPSEEYEDLRRRIYSNIKELWYYINHEFSSSGGNDQSDKNKEVLAEVSERKRSLLSDMEKLPLLDGYQDWRKNEAAVVSDLIQRRLHYLQNPADCRKAKKLICNLTKGCGFGCQIHHIVYCLIVAYATERTLILQSKGWRYNHKGWDHVFQPLSDSCNTSYQSKPFNWPAPYPEAQVVAMPFIDFLPSMKKPKFLPLAVPQDLAHRILRFNGDPASWWIGQFLKYILKLRPHLQNALDERIDKMHFKSPVVGVHIRRTDKVGTEAAFHHISEYMRRVEEYFDQLELTQTIEKRRVYLATDDADVLKDARSKYPKYEFLGDESIAKTAATHRRYTPESLTGLLVDLNMLARSDYIVCTFSSQVCRVAYEMMQANRMDASQSFFSLDDIYYFGGQNAHNRMALLSHKGGKNNIISFQAGDLLGIAGNHWNGYGMGTNVKSRQSGLIPWYKTTDHLVLFPFPIYEDVPLVVPSSQT